MYSLNVPVPAGVARLADELHPRLARFDRVRDQHTLVCKRLGDPGPGEVPVLQGRVRRALAGTEPFPARVDGLGLFAEPTAGPGPVVYLAVESPGLVAAHERLSAALGTRDGVEGADYVPHVTLARGGRVEDARALAEADVPPVEWTVDELAFRERVRGAAAGRVELPA